MMRLLVLAALVLLAYRLLVGRWPWEKRLSVKERALVKARRLLALSSNPDRAEIIAAHRRKLSVVHPDRGGSGAGVHEANEARDLLLAHLAHSTNNDPKEPS